MNQGYKCNKLTFKNLIAFSLSKIWSASCRVFKYGI